jgi:hypothetical protein
MSVVPSRQHFGDLLGSERASNERILLSLFENPLDRLLLSADGTLQLLISTWHGRVVQVKVLKHEPNTSNLTVDREVELCFADDGTQQPFCNAKSSLTFKNDDLMEKARLFGIGQLFREMNQLPRFELLNAGKDEGEGITREYRMSAEGIDCLILETFRSNPLLLEMPTSTSSLEPVQDKEQSKGFQSDARLSSIAPPQLTAVQRLFCMAHGNVQRLSSALLGEAVNVRLLEEKEIQPGNFFRNVELEGAETHYPVCKAQSHIVVKDEQLLALLHQGTLQLGSLARTLGAYPKFELQEVTWTSPWSFTRGYALDINAGAIVITVKETLEWPREGGLGALSAKYNH